MFKKSPKKKDEDPNKAIDSSTLDQVVDIQEFRAAVSKPKTWLELASLEQQIAELAQAVASQQQAAAVIWETVDDEDLKQRAHEIENSAWSLEKALLQLVEAALSRAHGELDKS